MKILLVEDEPNVAAFIKQGLEEQNFTVDTAFDGKSGLNLFSKNQYDLVLLDIMLPVLSGIEVCKGIRISDNSTPILMLTALSSSGDIVEGLNTGADDYLVKPFKFQELLARINALGRRKFIGTGRIYKIADLELDINTRSVKRNNNQIKLTPKEYYLLNYLFRNKGILVSRSDIAENIWEESFEKGSNIIDVYINYLRNKIDKGYDKKLIHTVTGMGYILKEE
jgi:two-component system copper resistance phosphate regulon response regulator CusR